MNRFLAAAIRSLVINGVSATYSVKGTPTLDIETGVVTSNNSVYSIRAIPKPIRANQYNYPDLIGKETLMLYVVNNELGFSPSVNDKFTIDSDTFTVQSIIKHYAHGQLILYKLISVKG